MYCKYCGQLLSSTAKFCLRCGNKIDYTIPFQQQIHLGNSDETNSTKGPASFNSSTNYGFAHNQIPGDYNATHSDMNNIIMSKSYDMPIVIKGISMKWYNFFVKYLIIIWIVLGSINELSATSEIVQKYFDGDFMYYLYNSSFGGLGLYNVITDITQITLLVIARRKLMFYKLTGLFLIIVYFGFVLYSVLTLHLLQFTGSTSMIGEILGMLSFMIPNIVYFCKRRSVFTS